jgi:hypothetical protein
VTKTPKDPVTWSSACEAAFHSARTDHNPTASDRARVLRGLADSIANEPSENAGLERAGAEQAATQGTHGLSVLKLVKVALGAASVLFGAFGLMQALDIRLERKPAEEPITLASGPSAASPELPAVSEAAPTTPPDTATPAASAPLPQPPVGSLRRDRGRSAIKPKPTARTHHERLRNDATHREPDQSSDASNQDVRQTRAEAVLGPHEPSGAPTPSDHAQTPSAAIPAENMTQRPPHPRGSQSEPVNDGPSEALFVARINKAVMDAKLRAALALCDEHERRWPQSRFRLEREALRAIAACGLNAKSAEMLAQRFLAANATAPLAPNVREACVAQLKTAK